MKSNSYVLKNENEVDRLARQSQSINYNVAEEISGVKIEDGEKVLEIGCGAGSLISYLNMNNKIDAHACDLQLEHVDYCKKNCSSDITFFQHDAVLSDFTQKYDHIFIRYVGHHLGVDLFKKCLLNAKNALHPDGRLTIIDIDSLFEGIGTLDNNLLAYIQTLSDKFSGDLRMGRKIPQILNSLGFESIDVRLDTTHYQGRGREEEVEQFKERIAQAKSYFVEMLGSEMDFQRFSRLFIQEISNPDIPFFSHRFIIQSRI